jgi:hypothetical protein
MTTIKDILTENRESVISSIKYMFKIWKAEDVKVKMIEFLAYAEKYGDVEMLSNSKRVKTDLKELVAHMKMSESFDKKDDRKWYEIAEDIADKKGLYWNSLTGEFEKI